MCHILLTITRPWKQPKCPSTEEWIKVWYIYTMENYLAIKKECNCDICSDIGELESVIESEVSQKEKNKYCILMHLNRI